jgi:hypothetical protein
MLTAERVIIAQDQTPSAITIFHGLDINLQALPAQPTPSEQLLLPMNWAVLAGWLLEEGDEGKYFEQRVSVEMPNGEDIDIGGLRFAFAANVHKTALSASFFPIKGSGQYKVKIALREEGPRQRWKKAGESPINLRLEVSAAEG